MSSNMHYGATIETFQIAERLRRDMTTTEKLLWGRLCKNQLGVRIRRQHPIWKFVADFYCHDVRLVIEVDGDIHLKTENKAEDISREIVLSEFKIAVLRLTNEEVSKDLNSAIEKIKCKIELLRQRSAQKLKEEK